MLYSCKSSDHIIEITLDKNGRELLHKCFSRFYPFLKFQLVEIVKFRFDKNISEFQTKKYIHKKLLLNDKVTTYII